MTDPVRPPESTTLARAVELLEGLGGLAPMIQFMAKAAERSDRARDQAFSDLRAHLTAETDRLASTLRADAVDAAAHEVLRELLPALDELDEVLRVHANRADAPGFGALGIVRRKLREALGRLGIEELAAIAPGTPFDPEHHDGVPYRDAAPASVPSGTIVAVDRSGYQIGARLVRAPRVFVNP